jgi:hypothetical protein
MERCRVRKKKRGGAKLWRMAGEGAGDRLLSL